MGVLTVASKHAAMIVLDWPESKNALTMDTIVEVCAALRSAAEDESVSGIVLTGNGAFCSGFNVTRIGDGEAGESRRADIEATPQELIRTLVDLPVPTVAAIDGPAIGMGFDLALACDARLFGPEGWAMQGWGRIGLIPGTGGELLLRRLNPSLLWRLLDGQPRVSGEHAVRYGIGESVTGMSAREAAIARVESYAAMPRAALRHYVSLFRADLRAGLSEHLARCAQMQDELLADPELQTRIAAIARGSRARRPAGDT